MADSSTADGWPTESSSYVIREDIGQVCGEHYAPLVLYDSALAAGLHLQHWNTARPVVRRAPAEPRGRCA